MNINIGNLEISNVFLGNQTIKKIFIGNILLKNFTDNMKDSDISSIHASHNKANFRRNNS